MANAGTLKARLGLDNSQFKRGLNQSRGSVKGFVGAVRGMIAPLAAAMGAALSVNAVKNAMSNIDAQAKLARSLGTTVGSMQVLQRAGELAGVSLGELEKGSRDLTMRLSEAAEKAGPARDALKRMGLAADDLLALPLDQRIAAINAAMVEFVPAAERAALAGDLFGIKGAFLMSRLDPATLKQATAEMAAFGYTISQTDASKIELANDAISKIGLVTSALVNRITVFLAPALNVMATGFAGLMRSGGAVSATLSALGSVISSTVDWNRDLVTIVSSLVSELANVTLAATENGSALGAVFGALTTGLGVFKSLITGIASVIGFFADLIRTTGGFGEALSALKPLAHEVWDRLKRGGSLMGDSLAGVALSIQGAFAGAFATVVEKFAAMTSALARGWNSVMSTFGIESNASGMGTELAEDLRAKADGLKSAATEFNSSLDASWRGLATEPFKALEALKTEITRTAGAAETSMEQASDAAENMGDTIKDAGSGGAGALAKTKAATDDLKSGFQALQSTMKSSFVGLVSGAKTLKEALSDVLGKWRDMLAENLFDAMFKPKTKGGSGFFGTGFFGTMFSAILPSSTGKSAHSSSSFAKFAQVSPSSPRAQNLVPAAPAIAAKEAGALTINVSVEGARGDDHILALVQKGVSAGIQQFDRAVLPVRVRDISAKPRMR